MLSHSNSDNSNEFLIYNAFELPELQSTTNWTNNFSKLVREEWEKNEKIPIFPSIYDFLIEMVFNYWSSSWMQDIRFLFDSSFYSRIEIVITSLPLGRFPITLLIVGKSKQSAQPVDLWCSLNSLKIHSFHVNVTDDFVLIEHCIASENVWGN